MRLVACSLLLLGLAFVQAPGLLVADTKFDLAVDPGGFLARALHLWDPEAAFGQLQNQAYGYWWPMGPFFWVFHSLGVEGWVIQRLWIGAVLVVAFVGATLVCRALGITSELACLVAGAAYALSPRIVSIVGGISIEAWPSAVAPWVLLPLVLGARTGSARRAAALSALAVGMVGGVNAAATAAVLPLGAVWLLSRRPGPRRRTMLLWWPAFTFLATAWWLVPLFLLGAYSPPFLAWIESASVTTFPTTPFDALRGTSAWIPYIERDWQAGNDLLRLPHLVLNSGVLIAAGLTGLLLRRNPHRVFLGLSLTLGMVLVTLGHLGAVQGWGAEAARGSLDGFLAPLRNVHKLDPVVRVPLVVGLAWFLQAALTSRGRGPHGSSPFGPLLAGHGQRVAAVLVALVAVGATASPALLGRLAPSGGTAEVPGYWQGLADWLAERQDRGTALLVPGSSFGSYVWGSPRDEPLQPLAESSWAVRNAVPLAPAGNIRMLDAVEERLSQGVGSPGLAAFLQRAGVAYLVVRNDLERGEDVPDPVLVHRALEDSPGVARVATFGPVLGGGPTTTVDEKRVVVNGGWQSTYRAIEVFMVGDGQPGATSSEEPTTVVGGPEDLLDLTDIGVLASGPAVLATHAATDRSTPGPLVLTDGLRDRERFFGRIHDARSPVRSPGQPLVGGNPTRDYLLPDPERWSTTSVALGDGRVTASSSAAEATVPGGARPGYHPYAALDGDVATSYRSNPADERPSWRLTLDRPTPLAQVQVTAGPGADVQQRVAVRTQDGVVGTVLLGPGQRRTLPVDVAEVEWLEVSAAGPQQLDLAEVVVPGVSVRRWLRTPEIPAAWGTPDTVVLSRDRDRRTGCTVVDGDVRCSPEQPRNPSEEPSAIRRLVTLPATASYPVRLWVTAAPRAAEQLVQRDWLVGVTASSRQYADARASAVAAVDGDPGSTWVAAQIDPQPSLTVRWLRERRVRGVVLQVDSDAPARAPRRVRVSWDGGQRTVRLDEEGRARFRPFRADVVSLQVLDSEDTVSLGFDNEVTPLPVGVSELRILGAPGLPAPVSEEPRSYPCGSGPTIEVGDRRIPTRVRVSDREAIDAEQVEARPCGSTTVSLAAGTTAVSVEGSEDFLPAILQLGSAAPVPVTDVQVAAPDPTTRFVTGVDPGHLVALSENTNPGWSASQGDEELAATVVDGWRSGWWSVSDEPIRVSFTPDAAYRAGLLGGGVLVLVLLGVLVRARRWSTTAPALQTHELPTPLATGLAVVAAGLLGGWSAAALGLVWSLLLRRVWSTSRLVAAGGTAALIAASTAAYALRPWGSPEGWAGSWALPGYLTVLAVVGVVAVLGSPATSLRKRIAGLSTSR